jgi:hypothetical protein
MLARERGQTYVRKSASRRAEVNIIVQRTDGRWEKFIFFQQTTTTMDSHFMVLEDTVLRMDTDRCIIFNIESRQESNHHARH